jgi:GNAT superfamily N-acetyltransferase
MEIYLREAGQADVYFSRSLYFETMRGMIESLFGWDQRHQEESFGEWFDLQEASIIVADGSDVGWMQIRTNEQEVLLASLYVRPEMQHRGIGTHVLREVITRCQHSSKTLTLAVMKANPAIEARLSGPSTTNSHKMPLFNEAPQNAATAKGEMMTRTVAEILLLTSLAINAALLIFIADVLRMVMNDMNESEFKQFVVSLVHHSKKSPFMLTVLNIPFLGAIPYFYFYRFVNRWLLAGLTLWLVAGVLGKTMKLPIYRAVEIGDTAKLKQERRKLNTGNMIQAILNSLAVVLAFMPFVR